MLTSWYHVMVDLPTMKRLCSMNLWGTNLEGLLSASRGLGFKAQAFKGNTNKESLHSLPLPFIAHVTVVWLGIKVKHYVVVVHITELYIEIWDPNPKVGIKQLTYDAFLSIWTGYIVFITLT
jgi:ABC-type bacteriocin/lantibiotic exporter with double-glycine peptidase domain